ncbi:MAG TPA: hypothetical protein VFS67_35535 [Polyangiaceae bacterium]|nr:hypothetical protein [Polyangiaceae bacterium]
MTPKEAAAAIGCSYDALTQLRIERQGPVWHRLPNGRIEYNPASVGTYAAARAGGATHREATERAQGEQGPTAVALEHALPQLAPGDLLTRAETAQLAQLDPAKLDRLVLVGRFPKPVRELATDAVWEARVVHYWTRDVAWTDLFGFTQTGPYWLLRSAAADRGVQLPENGQLPTAGAGQLKLHNYTGNWLPGAEVRDINYLNAEPDQLTGDEMAAEVNWTDDRGNALGKKPLIAHMQDRQAAYGITPNRHVLSPATPAPGR